MIDDGVIAAVASAESVRREGTIDLGGAFVMPGDPTAGVGALRGLDFVMRDGVVVRDDRGRTAARS
ncbi:hypothetical protein [Microbacterium sp. E-13]|uniref:hypothetical protein n=1 Tax=Microbacterium sp. E-13 TaxID=3404048 RepID=UPI003CF098EF